MITAGERTVAFRFAPVKSSALVRVHVESIVGVYKVSPRRRTNDVRELDRSLAVRVFWPVAWVRTPARKDAEARSIRCPCCDLWKKFGFAGTVHYEGAPGDHELTSLR